MKNSFFILFVLSFHFAHAITGTRNDAILFYLSFIAFMTFILAVLYSISFIRKIIKEHKDKKIKLPADKIESENNN